jgi:hypothetical protein
VATQAHGSTVPHLLRNTALFCFGGTDYDGHLPENEAVPVGVSSSHQVSVYILVVVRYLLPIFKYAHEYLICSAITLSFFGLVKQLSEISFIRQSSHPVVVVNL